MRPDYRSREYRRQKTNDHLSDTYLFYSKERLQESLRSQEGRQEGRPQESQEGRQEGHQEGSQEGRRQEGRRQVTLSPE